MALLGTEGIALAISPWATRPAIAGRIGLLLFGPQGITEIQAALFPVNAPGSPTDFSSSIRNTADMSFSLIAPALLLIELSGLRAGNRSRLRPITIWLARLVLLGPVVPSAFNGSTQSLGIGGAIQRLFRLVNVLWLLLKAGQGFRTQVPASVVRTAGGMTTS